MNSEQGLGDSIQFIQYVNPLKKLGSKIIVQVEKVLEEFFRLIPDIQVLGEKRYYSITRLSMSNHVITACFRTNAINHSYLDFVYLLANK